MAVLLVGLVLAATPLWGASRKQGAKSPAKTSARAAKSNKAAAPAQNAPKKPADVPAHSGKGQDLGLQMDKNFQNLPTFVTSGSLALDTQKRVFTYSGNVVVKHGDLTLTCNALEGNYDQSNQIQTMVAHGDVTIVKGENMKATGQRAIYNKVADTIVLSENPLLEQNGSTLSATEIKLFLEDNRSVAEGDVRVKLESKAGDTSVKLPGLGR